jgi:hypothetical protein
VTLGTAELASLREHAEASMLDACVLGTLAESGSGWGTSSAPTWTYATTEIACGVGPQQSDQVQDGSGATITHVDIRLPHGAAVTGQHRIKVTKRFGVALATPEYYAIDGAPHSGVSAIICRTRRITGASLS